MPGPARAAGGGRQAAGGGRRPAGSGRQAAGSGRRAAGGGQRGAVSCPWWWRRALRSCTENLGWGPWSVFDCKAPLLHDTVVRGQPCEFRMIGAETKVDGLGFKLIQPVCTSWPTSGW
jgi:hypothetical protein